MFLTSWVPLYDPPENSQRKTPVSAEWLVFCHSGGEFVLLAQKNQAGITVSPSAHVGTHIHTRAHTHTLSHTHSLSHTRARAYTHTHTHTRKTKNYRVALHPRLLKRAAHFLLQVLFWVQDWQDGERHVQDGKRLNTLQKVNQCI